MDPDSSVPRFVDHLAWAAFAVGLACMLGVVLVSLRSESDGDYRTWEQIRYHGNRFLGAAGLAIFGPTVAVLARALLWRRESLGDKKPPADDLDNFDA